MIQKVKQQFIEGRFIEKIEWWQKQLQSLKIGLLCMI
jgi:hypothetical protein